MARQLKEVAQQAEVLIHAAWVREARARHAGKVALFPAAYCARCVPCALPFGLGGGGQERRELDACGCHAW